MKVGVYGQSNNVNTIKYVDVLVSILSKSSISIVFEKNIYRSFRELKNHKVNFETFSGYEDLDTSFDLFFSVGGDGTFLRSITFVRDLNIPIIGINTGRLGFLATIQKEKISQAIDQILKNQFTIQIAAVR